MNRQIIKSWFFLLLITPLLASAAKDESNWNNVLKNQYYAGQSIKGSDGILLPLNTL